MRRHLRALLEDERYALQAALTLRACLRRDYAGLMLAIYSSRAADAGPNAENQYRVKILKSGG